MRLRAVGRGLFIVGISSLLGPGQKAPLAQARIHADDAQANKQGFVDGWQLPDHDAPDKPVGLSLWFQDGQVRKQDLTPKTTLLVDGRKRYIQEIDITASVATATDQGITPIIQQGDLASLDWNGVQMVDEQWRPQNDGTTHVIRQRFYRGAKWMKRNSAFAILPMDDNDHIVGDPIFSNAGKDDDATEADDGFVRRFVARQVTFGCNAVNDCSGATQFVAEGLVQFRDAMHPDLWARNIPKAASKLGLMWTADPTHIRKAPVTHANREDVQWGYGFVPKIAVTNPPQNGKYYMPGEGLDLQLSFYDGEGNRLFAPGDMPTYKDFENDDIASGLRYYDGFREVLQLYYALKHREGNMLVDVMGPTDQLHFASKTPVPGLFDLFGPQTTFVDAAYDGFTSIATLQPPALSELPPGDVNPVSDTIHFTLPMNVKSGTYIVTFKARRDYGGEALNRVGSTEIQVGQSAKSPPTVFKTGHCNECHKDRSDFDVILHGVDDRRQCFGCHPGLGFEPDHALDCRVHTIHSRSNRFDGDFSKCSTCHLDTPTGPARCAPGQPLLP